MAECSSGPNWQQNTVNDEASTDSERTHQSTDYLRDLDGEVQSLRSADEIALSPRQLSTVGYTLKVAVYYDDMFNNEFGANAVTRIDAIMALVDEMYAEDTFQVFLFVLDMQGYFFRHFPPNLSRDLTIFRVGFFSPFSPKSVKRLDNISSWMTILSDT